MKILRIKSKSSSSIVIGGTVAIRIAIINLIIAGLTMSAMSINLIVIGVMGVIMYLIRWPLEALILFFAVKKLKENKNGILRIREGLIVGFLGSLLAQFIYMMIIPTMMKVLMPEIGNTGGAKLGFIVGGFFAIFTTSFYGIIIGAVSGIILKSNLENT